MKVVYTTPRVENLQFLKSEISSHGVVVLEEPKNDLFYDALEGKITVDFYVRKIDTPYPLYTEKLMEMLKELRGKEILQVEPYLEEVEKLKNLGVGDERVREMEKRVNSLYIDYTESFLKADFEEVVEKILRFSKAEAERIVLRDEMRAKALENMDDAAIEAGMNHFKLAEILDAKSVRIPEIIAERIGTTYLESPGEKILKAFIFEEDEDLKLLAARNLIFITLLEKREMEPDFDGDFPHFMYEQKLVRFVDKLDYEKCKKLFHKFWSPK